MSAGFAGPRVLRARARSPGLTLRQDFQTSPIELLEAEMDRTVLRQGESIEFRGELVNNDDQEHSAAMLWRHEDSGVDVAAVTVTLQGGERRSVAQTRTWTKLVEDFGINPGTSGMHGEIPDTIQFDGMRDLTIEAAPTANLSLIDCSVSPSTAVMGATTTVEATVGIENNGNEGGETTVKVFAGNAQIASESVFIGANSQRSVTVSGTTTIDADVNVDVEAAGERISCGVVDAVQDTTNGGTNGGANDDTTNGGTTNGGAGDGLPDVDDRTLLLVGGLALAGVVATRVIGGGGGAAPIVLTPTQRGRQPGTQPAPR